MFVIEKCHITLYWTPAPAPAPLSLATGHAGKGLHPPGGVQWKPGPASALLGPVPSLVTGATCSGLFKLHVTVAYAEGLGLDTTPQQLTAEV